MTTDRFDYHRIKPGNYGMIKGCVLALSIHGVLFFVGGRLFVKPVQYSVQSDNGSIDVDLVAALPKPDIDTVKTITPITEPHPEMVKIAPQEEQTTLPQTDAETIESIPPVMEKHHETVKPPQPDVDAAQSITSITKQRQEIAKTMPRPSQGTVRTKSKPGYFQNRPPNYPTLAKQMHQEGLVMLLVEVDRKGMAVKVEVKQSSGYQLLDQAALEAVMHWRFQPERIGDIPIESKVTIPIRFRLEE